MSVSPVSSAVTDQYESGIVSMLGASGSSSSGPTAVDPTNLQQTADDQTILAMNPALVQTISEQAASPSLVASAEAMGMLTGTSGTTTESQSLLSSLATSLQLWQNLSDSGALTSNTSLAQSLLQHYTTPSAISPGSLVNTTA